MKNIVLTIIFIFFLFLNSFSQCKTYGFYLNYGTGTNFKGGTSMTIEVGYPKITSPFFLTGIFNALGKTNSEFYYSYGIQFNNKTRIGNNDLIQYVNILNSHESYSYKTSISGTIGVKWLQRVHKDGNFFFMGNLGYRQLDFNSLKEKNENRAIISELGVVIVL